MGDAFVPPPLAAWESLLVESEAARIRGRILEAVRNGSDGDPAVVASIAARGRRLTIAQARAVGCRLIDAPGERLRRTGGRTTLQPPSR